MSQAMWMAFGLVLAVAVTACERREGVASLAEDTRPLAREILRNRERKLEALLAERGSAEPDLAAAHGELGKAYQAFDLNERAAAHYEDARRLAPSVFDWHYFLARVRMSLGEPEAAVLALERALALEAANLLALLYLGEIETASGHIDRARAAYERALRVSPDCAPASFALGRIALLQGDAPEAVRRLEEALAAEPGAGRIHGALAAAYRQLGDIEKSRLHLAKRGDSVPALADPLMDEVAEINPRSYAPRALQALRSGNVARAVALLRAASAALPEDVEVRVQLGIALSSAGASREAVAEYREALRLDRENPRALYYLGTTLASMGRDEEAVTCLRRASQRGPENAQPLLALARVLRRLGRLEEAHRSAEEAVRLDPSSVEARLEEATLLARLGRCGDAAQRVEKGLHAFPGQPALTGLLARLLTACSPAEPAERERALRAIEERRLEPGW